MRRQPSRWSGWPAAIPAPGPPRSCGRTCWPGAARSAASRTSACAWRTTARRTATAADQTYVTQAARARGLRVRPGALPRLRRAPTARRTWPTGWRSTWPPRRWPTPASPDGEGLPREATGVLVGNTLTGEFSRAGLHAAALAVRAPRGGRRPGGRRMGRRRRAAGFLAAAEARYKAPFPPVGEETLAGGLSNTIAGRICNHFDLKGGGYTVDGACASSLLAVAQACSALAAGDLDVALAGGVDLSLDPFELVGFARTGALADRRDARVRRPLGRLLARRGVRVRRADALRGRAGAAAPRLRGAARLGRLVRRRAAASPARRRRGSCWPCAGRTPGPGSAPETVAYFEGHGTGTAVGDATELRVHLPRAARGRRVRPRGGRLDQGEDRPHQGGGRRRRADQGRDGAARAGHPPHDRLRGAASRAGWAEPRVLRVPAAGEPWPADRPLRAA